MTALHMWWQKPFDADMDVPHWLLFTLLIILCAGFWVSVIKHIEK